MSVKYKPDSYHSVTPYLVVREVTKLMDFLARTFGAAVVERMALPDGTILHAEMSIGDSRVMMGEARGEMKPMPATLYVYVPDVDATYAKALEAGAVSVRPPANQFYGDRSAGVRDACGNEWGIATHVEDVAPEEMQRRAAQAMQQAG